MNRRQLMKGLFGVGATAAIIKNTDIVIDESPRELPETGFGLVQPKAEGSTFAYDPVPHQIQFHDNSEHYGTIHHDGEYMVIENAKTGRKLLI